MTDTGTVTLAGLPERWISRIEVGESGCWLWTGGQNSNGYGRTSLGTRNVVAHRAVYEAIKGAIGDGLQLDHLCRTRHCVNPDHLEPVTQRTNLLRGETIVARAAGTSHCPAGHAYDGDNLYLSPAGDRRCKACHRARSATRRAADPERARADGRRYDTAYRARKRADRQEWAP